MKTGKMRDFMRAGVRVVDCEEDGSKLHIHGKLSTVYKNLTRITGQEIISKKTVQ